jgi:hypothetical protein
MARGLEEVVEAEEHLGTVQGFGFTLGVVETPGG